jgi:predicted Ser/Thr protein kinase
MKNKVKMYQRLKALAPELRFTGFFGEVFVIGTTRIKGKHLSLDRQQVITQLKKQLEYYNVDHGDLRNPNILVDEQDKYWIIDFGKSSLLN